MKISVFSIQNQGNPKTEVATLKVDEDCNLNNYIVTEAKASTDGAFSASFRNTYWFRPKDVKKGDYVLLFTRDGADVSNANELGSTTHILHWKSDHPVWIETESTAVVLELSEWKSKPTRAFVMSV